jgi:predicted house-cleaning noncanonical NTP pyrophosphatase (MazG superfamily)
MKRLKEYLEERIKDCAQMSWTCHHADTSYWMGLYKKYQAELNSLTDNQKKEKFSSKIEVINYFGFEA